jgi:hypothetical protein
MVASPVAGRKGPAGWAAAASREQWCIASVGLLTIFPGDSGPSEARDWFSPHP